jgi:uroporphyrinogen-III synthase
MRVLVTRPEAQARDWVRALAALGIDSVALPLIDIGPPADAQAVAAAWHGLQAHRLVVFVSPNAAERFFALRPAGAAWPAGAKAASVGPGTSETLRGCGVPAGCIVEPPASSPRFDSEALWQALSAIEDWSGASVLVVRGDGGREWLADTLRAQGARVAFVSAYRRLAPRLDQPPRRDLLDAALAAPAAHLWFFSSAEAIDHLRSACPAVDWRDARAIATHPRIAERARDCGFGVIHETRPTLDAVRACIQSIAS